MPKEMLAVALVMVIVGGAFGFFYSSAFAAPKIVVSVSTRTITVTSTLLSISTLVSTETKTVLANSTTNLELVNESLKLSMDLSSNSVYENGTAVSLNVTLTNIGSAIVSAPTLYDSSQLGVALPNGTVVEGSSNPPSAGLATNVTLLPNQSTTETFTIVFGNKWWNQGDIVSPPGISNWTLGIMVQVKGTYTLHLFFWYPQFYETLVLPVNVNIM